MMKLRPKELNGVHDHSQGLMSKLSLESHPGKIKNEIKQVFENIKELQSEYNLTIMKSNWKSITEKHSNN